MPIACVLRDRRALVVGVAMSFDDDDVPTTQVDRVLEKDATHETSFVRWFLVRFTTRAHFMRFLATIVMCVTVFFIVSQHSIPEGWWGIFGMTLGYYFRGPTGARTEHD